MVKVMDKKSVVFYVRDMDDIKKLKNSSYKYLNLDLKTIDRDVVDYLISNGKDYLYGEISMDKVGCSYVDYKTFAMAEGIISNLLNEIDNSYSDIMKARLLYIKLGKLLSYDINVDLIKNEDIDYFDLTFIDNVWGSLSCFKTTNKAVCKIYFYLLSRLNIDNKIIFLNETDSGNMLNINGITLIVDLYKDIPYIKASFRTLSFNDCENLFDIDKKILYIDNVYNEDKIDSILKKYDNILFKAFLDVVNSVVDVFNIGVLELGIILNKIFVKYCNINNIYINNYYINNGDKESLIIIRYKEKKYSYNYRLKCFIVINDNDFNYVYNNDIICLYKNEEIANNYYLDNEKEIVCKVI